ncbi:MerR family transcriptional regulator [Chloroflexota bacterium]
MFKIGDFSKLSFVTVKTLHYYDEIGLLKPAKVDRFTGYRYYSADQLPRLNYIAALKNLGLSLEEIATLSNNDLTPSQMRDIFFIKKAELQQRVREEQRRLEQVENLLKQIEKEGTMPDYQVVIKKVESQIIASIRAVLPNYSAIGQLYGEIFGFLGSQGITIPAGPTLFICHDPEFKEKDVDVEAGVPIGKTIPESGRIRVYELSGLEEAACAVYKGPYENIGEAYSALMSWIEANGYQITGPDRELYLTSPADTKNPPEYVTEIQFPVKKA